MNSIEPLAFAQHTFAHLAQMFLIIRLVYIFGTYLHKVLKGVLSAYFVGIYQLFYLMLCIFIHACFIHIVEHAKIEPLIAQPRSHMQHTVLITH